MQTESFEALVSLKKIQKIIGTDIYLNLNDYLR